MRATRKEREDFLLAMQREGVPAEVARKVLRHTATHQRLAEAECNGDWPCDNGERPVEPCPKCEAGYVRSALKPICPSCRAEAAITKLLAPFNVVPDFQGDPRGATVKLKVPSGRTDDWGQTGICVPS